MWELRRRGLIIPLLIFLQPDLDYKCPRSVECQNVGVRRENGLKSYCETQASEEIASYADILLARHARGKSWISVSPIVFKCLL